MLNEIDIRNLSNKIHSMKKLAEELRQSEHHFPALQSNTSRILASIKMLEINICDLAEGPGEDL